MGITLHQHGHSHSSSHNRAESQIESHSPRQNINVRAAFIHVLGDFIQSFGVFIAALVIFFKVRCSFIFAILTVETQSGKIKERA